ncbi:hypothetical protein Tco_0873882 [Tanacetum coccineum]|uniref:Uncharacterized protein n=1 Tax=Tanacetum coccineum TaxID=301880 RepID=A0ABQ5BKG1_9ASTR
MIQYIRPQTKNAQRHGQTFNWETATYDKVYCEDFNSFMEFEADFPAIVYNDALTSNENVLSKPTVNRVHVLDFARLTEEMRQTLADRLRMVYTGDDGQELFTIYAWRRLFEIRGPLLGEARRRMTWRQFILDLGLHTSKEMTEDRFEAYCISSRGHAPKKVTGIDLFYLRSMDQGTTNVPYLLAQYLFRHAEGRKSRAMMSVRYFIRRLVDHFGLVSDEGLMGLSVITRVLPMINLYELVKLNIYVRLGDTWAWVAQGLERQQVAAAGAPEVAEGIRLGMAVGEKKPTTRGYPRING